MMLLAAKKRNPGLLSTSEVSQNTQDNPIQFTQRYPAPDALRAGAENFTRCGNDSSRATLLIPN